MNTTKTRAALAVLAMLAAGFTSACGANPIKNAIDNAVDDAVGGGVENIIENAAGDDVDIDFDFDGDGASLPGSFPDDIPRPDAKLTGAFSTSESWTLAYAPVDASTVEALVSQYRSGWETQGESDLGELKSWQFVNDSYLVVLGAIQDGDEWTISLTAATVTE